MCTWRRLAAPVSLLACRRAGAGAAPRAQVTVSGEATATFGSPRRHRVLQLHRLRAQRAADVPRCRSSGMWRPAARLAFLTELRSEDAQRVIPYALYVRVRPLEGPRLRHPGRPHPAGVRRLRPARRTARDNPLIGYPARLPIPDVAAARRHPGDRRRSAGHAGARLARRAIPSASHDRRRRACRSSPPIAGTPASQAHARAPARSKRRSRSPAARCRTRAWTTTTADARSPAASRGSRSSAWSSAHRPRAASS